MAGALAAVRNETASAKLLLGPSMALKTGDAAHSTDDDTRKRNGLGFVVVPASLAGAGAGAGAALESVGGFAGAAASGVRDMMMSPVGQISSAGMSFSASAGESGVTSVSGEKILSPPPLVVIVVVVVDICS